MAKYEEPLPWTRLHCSLLLAAGRSSWLRGALPWLRASPLAAGHSLLRGVLSGCGALSLVAALVADGASWGRSLAAGRAAADRRSSLAAVRVGFAAVPFSCCSTGALDLSFPAARASAWTRVNQCPCTARQIRSH